MPLAIYGGDLVSTCWSIFMWTNSAWAKASWVWPRLEHFHVYLMKKLFLHIRTPDPVPSRWPRTPMNLGRHSGGSLTTPTILSQFTEDIYNIYLVFEYDVALPNFLNKILKLCTNSKLKPCYFRGWFYVSNQIKSSLAFFFWNV